MSRGGDGIVCLVKIEAFKKVAIINHYRHLYVQAVAQYCVLRCIQWKVLAKVIFFYKYIYNTYKTMLKKWRNKKVLYMWCIPLTTQPSFPVLLFVPIFSMFHARYFSSHIPFNLFCFPFLFICASSSSYPTTFPSFHHTRSLVQRPIHLCHINIKIHSNPFFHFYLMSHTLIPCN